MRISNPEKQNLIARASAITRGRLIGRAYRKEELEVVEEDLGVVSQLTQEEKPEQS